MKCKNDEREPCLRFFFFFSKEEVEVGKKKKKKKKNEKKSPFFFHTFLLFSRKLVSVQASAFFSLLLLLSLQDVLDVHARRAGKARLHAQGEEPKETEEATHAVGRSSPSTNASRRRRRQWRRALFHSTPAAPNARFQPGDRNSRMSLVHRRMNRRTKSAEREHARAWKEGIRRFFSQRHSTHSRRFSQTSTSKPRSSTRAPFLPPPREPRLPPFSPTKVSIHPTHHQTRPT